MRGLEDEDSHLATATVDGELRAVCPLSVQPRHHRHPAAGVGHVPIVCMDGYAYLVQRKDLTVRSNPEALFWAWIPVTGSAGGDPEYLGR